MAFDWDAFNEEYGFAPLEQEPTTEETDYGYAEERGLFGDIGSGVLRGTAYLTELGAEGLDVLGFDTGIDEWIEEARDKYDILKPDESEYFDDSLFAGLRPGAFTEQLTTSLGAAAPGAIAGGLAFGPIGAAIGGLGSTLLAFGLGEGNKRYEELIEMGYSHEEATKGAMITGGIEGGIESVASGIDLFTAGSGKAITTIAKQGIKATARNMLKMSGRDALRKTAVIMGTENFTEQLQAELGRQEDMRVGLATEGLTLEDRAQNFITTSAMSLLFAGGAVGYSAKQKRDLKKALTNGTRAEKQFAADTITKQLQESGDTDLAGSWKMYTDSHIRNDVPITLDDAFVEIGDKVNNVGIERSDITSPNPDIANNAADKILKGAGINEDGSIDAETLGSKRELAEFVLEAEEAIKGKTTNAGQKLKEAQLKKQEDERVRAEKQLSSIEGAPDPLITLEEQYKEVEKGRTPEEKKEVAEAIVAEAEVEPTPMVREEKSAAESAEVFEEAGPLSTEGFADIVEQEAIEETVEQADLQAFADSVDKYVKSRNNKATIADYFTSADANKKLEMFRLMQEVEADTNNVRKQEENVVQELEQVATTPTLTEEQQEATIDLPEAETIQAYGEMIEEGVPGEVIEATTMTPEMELERAEQLEGAGLTEDDLKVASDPEAFRNAATLPESKAFVEGDIDKAVEIFEDSRYSKDQIPAFMEVITRDLGQEVIEQNKEVYMDLMAQLRTSLTTQKASDVKGAKASDAIQWEKTRSNTQQGTHKETGEVVAIGPGAEKGTFDLYVGNELVETVAGKVAARQAMEKYVTPLSDEYKSRPTSYGTKKVEGATVSEKDIKGTKVDKTEEGDTKAEVSEVREIKGDELEELKKQYGGRVFDKKRMATEEELAKVEEQTFKAEPVMVMNVQSGQMEPLGANAKEMLENVLDRNLSDKWLKPLIEATLRRSGDRLSQIPVLLADEGAGSFYRKGRVFIDPSTGGTAPATRLHEAVHSITVEELRNDSELKADLDDLFFKARKQLLTDQQIDDLSKVDYNNFDRSYVRFPSLLEGHMPTLYAFTRPEEFISQAFSSPIFREKLNSMELRNKRGKLQNAWSMFRDFVMQALRKAGLGGQFQKGSALEKLFQIVDDLQNVQTDYISDERYGALTETELDASEAKHFGKESKVSKADWVKDRWKKTEKLFSEYLQTTQEAVNKISPSAGIKLRTAEKNINKMTNVRAKQAKPFLDKFKQLDLKDRQRLTLYLSNKGEMYEKRRDELLKDKGMEAEYKAVKDLFDSVYSEAEALGLNPASQMESYFPRFVKDVEGLSGYLRKQKDWGVIKEAIEVAKNKAEKQGIPFGENDKAQVITDIINTGRVPTALQRKPGAMKERTIDTISAGMVQYYAEAPEALGKYIVEMTEKIELAKMLGQTDRKAQLRTIRTLTKRLDEATTDKAKDKIGAQLESAEDKLIPMDQAMEQGIGNLIAKELEEGKINEEQEQRLRELFRARLTQTGANKLVSTLRTGALLGSLTQMTTGIRQISDNVWSAYQHGLMPTLSALVKTARGTGDIQENPFDFQSSIKEFSEQPKLVDNALKMSGIQFMDAFSKKVNLQAAIEAAKNPKNEKKFMDKWTPILGEEGKTKQALEDLKKGNMTPDTEYILFSSIADFQPVALSEMPQKYLTAGNMRILYLLKSYAIKSANNFYRESVGEIRKGNVKQGMKNLTQLGTLFLLANASTDWLIDWLNGREPDFSDSVVDSLLTLAITSRYTMDKAGREGLLDAQLGDMLPPTQLIDLPVKDILSLFSGDPTYQSLKLMPGVGSILYNRFTPEGRTKTLKRSRETIIDNMKGGDIDRAAIRDFNSEVRKVNRGLKKKGEKEIGTIGAREIRDARKASRDNMDILGSIGDLLGPSEAAAATLEGTPKKAMGSNAILSSSTISFLEDVEGVKKKMYVPTKGGKVLGTSGPTIASGFDLGQRNSIKEYNLSPSLAKKLEPYLGLKGQEALDYVKNNPLTLSSKEVSEINKAVKLAEAKKVAKKFDKDSTSTFSSLPEEWKTAIISVAFQYGNLETETPKFWDQVTNKEWKKAYKNLRNFGDDYKTRRNKEADLVKDLIKNEKE